MCVPVSVCTCESMCVGTHARVYVRVPACVGVDMTTLLKLIALMNNCLWSDDYTVAL